VVHNACERICEVCVDTALSGYARYPANRQWRRARTGGGGIDSARLHESSPLHRRGSGEHPRTPTPGYHSVGDGRLRTRRNSEALQKGREVGLVRTLVLSRLLRASHHRFRHLHHRRRFCPDLRVESARPLPEVLPETAGRVRAANLM
ncbi:MAG: hypothetical protein AVDCRST_MAG14-134, partial [uncultured Rubrobacteraceae bacterium]